MQAKDFMPASWQWYVDLEVQTAEMWTRQDSSMTVIHPSSHRQL